MKATLGAPARQVPPTNPSVASPTVKPSPYECNADGLLQGIFSGVKITNGPTSGCLNFVFLAITNQFFESNISLGLTCGH